MTLSIDLPIICFSHLRWDFVWQRPQQLMSRFARSRRVYFVEEPLFHPDAGDAPDDARLEARQSNGVAVCQPVCRDPGPGGGPRLDAMYARLSAELVRQQGLEQYVAWFYTPMLIPSLERLAPSLVVYDAMDELSLFRGAPPELLTRERELLQRAQVVFTGGVSLGKAKGQLHGNVHAFPSGVDAAHYRTALDESTEIPPDAVDLPHPQIGFFGVIDERADLELLAEAAALRPAWAFVMIGPVVKISAEDLPRLPNIHYLGQKQYADLPRYVKSLDVCMMPFALNDATKFISPTKTLEYMAAHKPIISTPVQDVVGSYRDAVRIARSGPEFVAAAEAALAETSAECAQRIDRERAILAQNAWDSIAERMSECMRQARSTLAT